MAKKADPTRSSNNRVVATNRKARHNYSILETFEAGVALMGTEVKSLRDGQASLADAFATVDDGEIWLRNLHIPEYHHGSWTNHAPRRNRKLLLHRKQIDTLVGKIRDGNLTLVPLSLYFSDGKVKVELALARGKQAHDKRQDMARRDAAARGDPRTGQARQGHDLIGVAFALASALGYGVSDFVGGIASRRVAALRVVLVSYPVAMVLLAGAGGRSSAGTSHTARCSGARCAVSRRRSGCGGSTPRSGAGPISVVSPLTAILVAGDPGRRRSGAGGAARSVAGVGVVLALVAVVLVSREATDEDVTPHRFTTKVAWLTVGSGRGVRAELRADRPGAARGQAVAAGVRPARGQRAGVRHRGGERAICGYRPERRCGWRCWRRCSTSAPTSRCCWHCRRRCCRWRAC